jgi:hypothetical protein
VVALFCLRASESRPAAREVHRTVEGLQIRTSPATPKLLQFRARHYRSGCYYDLLFFAEESSERDGAMKRISILGVAFATLFANVCVAQPPQEQIQNKQLRVKLYLPNARDGFYTGVRFDWSGAIADLEFSGHHLYRPWFASIDPDSRDVTFKDGMIVSGINSAMTGPVEEFQTPIGYESAKPGENFLKVGVGLLRKIDDKPYSFTTRFNLVDGGKWTVSKTAKSIAFVQVLGGPNSDYGYVYTKTIRLVGDASELVIEHRLKNTGKLPIATKLYDHNFLTMDGVQVGSGYSVSVPYKLEPTRPPDDKFVKIDGSTATYVSDLKGEDRVAFGLQGFSTDPKNYHFSIMNKAADVQVTISGDRPLVNAVVWSIRSVLAVEPFIDIQADSGKEALWSYTYYYSRLGAR